MRLTFIGSFVKLKTGIERVNEELINLLVQDAEVEHINIIAPRNKADFREDITKSNKISIHTFPPSLLKAPFYVNKFLKTVYKNPVLVIANIRPWAILVYKFYPFFHKKTKILQIVPDIIAWHYPKFFPFLTSFTFKIFGIFFKNFPTLYVVHSEFTKRDMIKEWGISESKINVVPLGSFVKPMTPRENFTGRKVLYVGKIEPRKGVDKLLEAFEIAKKEIQDIELIICGKMGWKVKDLGKKLERLSKEGKGVKYLGYVSDDELIKLFREVDVCVYPSIYEGFGLPPLEAMASGCPVIVSGNSSLPEVVGEAGLTINPYDPKEMASAIVRVLKDTNLKKQMSLLGIERAKALDLEKNLGELIKLIKSLK